MSRLIWDKQDYEAGLDRGVFYSQDGSGEAWNGLTSVKESSSDSDEQAHYIDGVKTHRRRRLEDFSGTIEAFTYPDSFYEDMLTQRRPKSFGLSYRVKSGDDYKIHLVYNALISPGGFSYKPFEAESFSWEFSTKPLPIPGGRLISAHLIVDTSKAYPWTVTAFENVLYGSESDVARLPFPSEVLDIFDVNSILKVTDNGDGSFTVEGPDDVIQMIDPTTFQITWPSAVYIDEDSYTLSSW